MDEGEFEYAVKINEHGLDNVVKICKGLWKAELRFCLRACHEGMWGDWKWIATCYFTPGPASNHEIRGWVGPRLSLDTLEKGKRSLAPCGNWIVVPWLASY
jgi:hypothetical protein